MRQQGASPEDLRNTIRKMRAGTRDTIIGVLRPEQREKFLEMSSRQPDESSSRGRVWVLNEKVTPVSVEIETGISDGNYTEVLKGKLLPDQELIVGIVRNLRTSSSRPTGRIGF
jgi:hypothetical protein